MSNTKKNLKKRNIVITPEETLKIISSVDKKNYVYITNKEGNLTFDLTYLIKHQQNISNRIKETKISNNTI